MTDRRRNGLILLLVAGLLLASLVVIATKPTRLGLDLKGGVELVYQGKPTPQQPKVTPDALDRALDIIRERVDQLGVGEPEIQRSGNDQITVGLPDVKNAQRAQSSRSARPPSCTSTTGRPTSSGRTASRDPADARSPAARPRARPGLPEYQALKSRPSGRR